MLLGIFKVAKAADEEGGKEGGVYNQPHFAHTLHFSSEEVTCKAYSLQCQITEGINIGNNWKAGGGGGLKKRGVWKYILFHLNFDNYSGKTKLTEERF